MLASDFDGYFAALDNSCGSDSEPPVVAPVDKPKGFSVLPRSPAPMDANPSIGSSDSEEFEFPDLSEVVEQFNSAGETLQLKQPSMIYCAPRINVQGTVSTKTTHDRVDSLNFADLVTKGKSFVEFLIKPEQQRGVRTIRLQALEGV